nr:unnamed protein product [Callosobruchus chinensis]
MTRRVVENGETKYVPINKVIVTFQSQPPISCHNCMRYGHLGKHCKSKPRCSKCHEGHVTSSCVSSFDIPKCLNCDEDHYAYEIEKCKEFERQKEIKTRMACSNLSYTDAEKSIPSQPSSNSLPLNRHTYSSSYSVRKRPRNNNSPDILDTTEQLRKNIISNPSLPSESGEITNESAYLNNLQKPVDESLLNTGYRIGYVCTNKHKRDIF